MEKPPPLLTCSVWGSSFKRWSRECTFSRWTRRVGPLEGIPQWTSLPAFSRWIHIYMARCWVWIALKFNCGYWCASTIRRIHSGETIGGITASLRNLISRPPLQNLPSLQWIISHLNDLLMHDAMHFWSGHRVFCVFQRNPSRRPSARQAMLHPWMRGLDFEALTARSVRAPPTLFDNRVGLPPIVPGLPWQNVSRGNSFLLFLFKINRKISS